MCVCERRCLEMCQSQVNRRDRMWAPKLKTSEADRVGSKRQECSSRVVPAPAVSGSSDISESEACLTESEALGMEDGGWVWQSRCNERPR